MNIPTKCQLRDHASDTWRAIQIAGIAVGFLVGMILVLSLAGIVRMVDAVTGHE